MKQEWIIVTKRMDEISVGDLIYHADNNHKPVMKVERDGPFAVKITHENRYGEMSTDSFPNDLMIDTTRPDA